MSDPLAQIERVRNILAMSLIASFVGALIALTYRAIPKENEQIITYMVGQLSGMATMALGFYFVSQVGKDALDAQKVGNTTKALDAIGAAIAAAPAVDGPSGNPGDPLAVKEEK